MFNKLNMFHLWFGNYKNKILFISIVINLLFGYLYLSDNSDSLIQKLNIDLQNVLVEKTELKKNLDGTWEQYVKLGKEVGYLKEQLQGKDRELVSAQKTIVNLKDQVLVYEAKLDEIEIVENLETNSLSIPFEFNQENILLNGNIDLFFNQELNVAFVRQNLLRMKINAILKQDPLQIVSSIVREKELLKSYIKLNRIHDGEIIESLDWLEANETIFNPEILKCPDPDKRLTLGFGYSPVAGLINLGFNHWGFGYVNTFSDRQGSYMILYNADIKDLFSSKITGLIF